MPIKAMTSTADMVDIGDDITIGPYRGNVLDVLYNSAALDIAGERIDVGDTVRIDGDIYHVQFLQPGDRIDGGGVVDAIHYQMSIVLSDDYGIHTEHVDGDSFVTIHNHFVPDDKSCQPCLKGVHHTEPMVRCECCGRKMSQWGYDFS